MKKILKTNKFIFAAGSGLNLLVIILLISLIITGVITNSWAYGFLLASTLGLLSFIVLRFSVGRLVKGENPFEFIFFSILRMGLYAFPLLISVSLANTINIYGVLIGTGTTVLLNLITIRK